MRYCDGNGEEEQTWATHLSEAAAVSQAVRWISEKHLAATFVMCEVRGKTASRKQQGPSPRCLHAHWVFPGPHGPTEYTSLKK